MDELTAAPAGWYDDGTGAQRWWDGTAWSDAYARAPEPVTAQEPARAAGPDIAPVPAPEVAGAPALEPAGAAASVAAVAPDHEDPLAPGVAPGLATAAATAAAGSRMARRSDAAASPRGVPRLGWVVAAVALLAVLAACAVFLVGSGRSTAPKAPAAPLLPAGPGTTAAYLNGLAAVSGSAAGKLAVGNAFCTGLGRESVSQAVASTASPALTVADRTAIVRAASTDLCPAYAGKVSTYLAEHGVT